ncbi:MAG: MFS transporter [Chloroflexi bacterium]|nr:MFS transporter [Chloroflexota bacterium]
MSTGRGRAAIAGFSIAHFSHHVTNSLLSPLLPLIRDTFALTYTEQGIAVSAFSLSVGIANAPMGVLADRIGSRAVLAGGLVLLGISSIALSLAGQYWHLLVLLAAMGIISGSYHAPAVALISRAFPERGRGAVMGLHTTGGHMSFFAAPLVAGAVATAAGTWRAPYLLFAIAPILSGVMLWQLAPRAHARGASRGRLAAIREVFDVFRRVGRVVTASIVFQIGFAAFMAFLAIYLVDARGVHPAVAAAMYALPQLAGVVGAPVGGWLSDRLGRRAVIATGLGALGPAIWLFTVTPTELVVIPLFVIGVAGAVRMTVTEVLVAESAPVERRATVLGTYYLLAAEVGGLAAPGLGVLATAVGIAAAFNAVALALTALSAFVILMAVARKL